MDIPKKTRSYSITCEEDNINIEKGKCPTYALSWDDNSNKPHWEKDHDFRKGYDTITKIIQNKKKLT